MQYICLIYTAEEGRPAPDSPLFEQMIQRYFTFTEKMQKEGKFIAGDALQPVATATTVSVRNGKTQTIDGPFAETKEQLGGYYLLECENLDEAIQCAAMIPAADHGRIEVRPVMVFDQAG